MVKQAAALILIRNAKSGIEVCMLRRVGSSRFAPGAYVFPGGGVEEQDKSLGHTMGITATTDYATEKIAAIREAFEEAGILAGASKSNITEQNRKRLHAGEISFQQLLDDHDTCLNLDAVVFYDHWITPEGAPIRFDTRFFLTTMLEGEGQELIHDDAETDASCWANPADLLAQYDRKEIKLMPVTHVQLKRLSMLSSVEDALTRAKQCKGITATLPVLNFDESGKPTSVTIDLQEGVVEYPVYLKGR
ncbi:MAG TPA: NUDIX domain-containing protein [Cycloclasticus sp.]|jgi:8-oxo-dGTP pyrophosphatase MutT (NUDIX family)|nr:NUDIX domain-containing protein [Cycloclasticus sp.]HIL92835.1 NUDIX domain-containing protein [Cycloclasticus sp.]